MKSIGVSGLVLKEAARGWTSHRAQRLGAALAFHTTLSLAPLTIIAIAVAGYVFGEEAARGGIVDQIRYLVGKDGAIAIESLIQKASAPQHSRIATMHSIGLFVFAATGVFAELKDSLDTIWEVKVQPGIGLWIALKTRLLSFAVVVGTGFLLMVSLLLTAMLTALIRPKSPTFRSWSMMFSRIQSCKNWKQLKETPQTDVNGQTLDAHASELLTRRVGRSRSASLPVMRLLSFLSRQNAG